MNILEPVAEVHGAGVDAIEYPHLVRLNDLRQYPHGTKLYAVTEEIIAKAKAYDRINSPEIYDFLQAVENEALHQRERWGSEEDMDKTDADWFWLVGYLAGKALNCPAKRLHHIITTAAACLNWHGAKLGVYTNMRSGIEAPKDSDGSIR